MEGAIPCVTWVPASHRDHAPAWSANCKSAPRPLSRLQGGSVTQRRSLVCAYLGIGDCDGKQLQRQLNRYGFTTEEVERALAWANRQAD